MIKAVLFDCDGVLLDSESIYLESLSAYLATLGREVSPQALSSFIGADIHTITNGLRKQYDLEQYDTETMIHGQRALFRGRFYHMDLTPMEGLIPLLTELKKRGILLAVVSSSDQSYVDYVTAKLGITSFFQLTAGRETARRAKPQPDLYLAALDRLSVSPQEALIVEDSFNGILAGKRAGCPVLAYTGAHVPQDISQADFTLENYGDFDFSLLD